MDNEPFVSAGPIIFILVLLVLLGLRGLAFAAQRDKERYLTNGKLPLGVYQHYKGKKYEVLCVSCNSETGEECVVYIEMEVPHRVWARPLEMFLATVPSEGGAVPRFRYCGSGGSVRD